MISPLSTGLFHGAIAQSGDPIIGSEYLNPVFNGNMANVSEMGQKLASKLGCDGAADVLAAMRARPAEEVIKAADCKTGLFDEGLFFAPVFDGTVLPGNPFTAFSRGMQHDVPIITGSTLNEGNVYLKDEKDLSLERYRSFLKSRFGENAGKVFAVFPASSDKDVPAAIDRVNRRGGERRTGAVCVAGSMERKKSRGYLYQFTRLPGTERARKLGVYHGVDLAYVFGNMKTADGYDSTDMTLSAAMMGYWVNFARTGDPNGQGLPHWPAYERTSDVNMEFSDTLRTGRHLFKEECDFINSQSIYRSR
jgi:para-nitrobenzyl esterase